MNIDVAALKVGQVIKVRMPQGAARAKVTGAYNGESGERITTIEFIRNKARYAVKPSQIIEVIS